MNKQVGQMDVQKSATSAEDVQMKPTDTSVTMESDVQNRTPCGQALERKTKESSVEKETYIEKSTPCADGLVMDDLSPNTINQLEIVMKGIEESSSSKKRKMVWSMSFISVAFLVDVLCMFYNFA